MNLRKSRYSVYSILWFLESKLVCSFCVFRWFSKFFFNLLVLCCRLSMLRWSNIQQLFFLFLTEQVQLLEKTQAASAADQKIHNLEAKVAEQKTLIVKLEEDILKVLFACLTCCCYKVLGKFEDFIMIYVPYDRVVSDLHLLWSGIRTFTWSSACQAIRWLGLTRFSRVRHARCKRPPPNVTTHTHARARVHTDVYVYTSLCALACALFCALERFFFYYPGASKLY